MSALEHGTYIKEGSALVVSLTANNHGQHRQVETFQGRCECGWEGPRRTARREAEDDNVNHVKFPYEDQ